AGSSIGLETLNGADGFKLTGEGPSDRAGGAVSKAGDVNGDGFDDLIIGAFRVDRPGGGVNHGAAYVVFGRSSFTGAPAQGFSIGHGTRHGTHGFTLGGGGYCDHAGPSSRGA